MPFQTIWESTGACQRFWGVLTSPELLDSLTEAHDDPRFDSLQYVIKDYLDVEVFDVGLKTLVDGLALGMVSKRTNPNIVVAVVTTNPQIIESSKSASSYRVDSYPRRIFPTIADAREWIKETKTTWVPMPNDTVLEPSGSFQYSTMRTGDRLLAVRKIKADVRVQAAAG